MATLLEKLNDKVVQDAVRKIYKMLVKYHTNIVGILDHRLNELRNEQADVKKGTLPTPSNETPPNDDCLEEEANAALSLDFSRNDIYYEWLAERLFDGLDRPFPCTVEDVAFAFKKAFALAPDRDPVATFREILVLLVGMYRRSAPIEICDELFKSDGTSCRVWSVPNRFELNIVGSVPVGHVGMAIPGNNTSIGVDTYRLYAQIYGMCSQSALPLLAHEAASLLRSLFKSFSLLVDESSVPSQGFSLINDGRLEAPFNLVPKCVSSYYECAVPKRRVEHRLRNAIALLVHADGQCDSAMKLALSMTAIEALCGVRGEGLSERLADAVATLCEPEPEYRRAASDSVKRLYIARCNVLHGCDLEISSNKSNEARLLAAGVLKAVTEHCECRRRMGADPEKIEQFADALADRKWEKGLPDGVVESRVRKLWLER